MLATANIIPNIIICNCWNFILVVLLLSQDSSQRNRRDLPEGFFDDPKKDAKARMVDYKDPLNEEWERFQKSIQKENDVRGHNYGGGGN